MNLSILVPCRNEVLYIEECIDAIFNSQNVDKISFKVFVVDGMSDDGTREKINSLTQKYQDVILVDNVQQLTPFAFNLGIYEGGKVDFVQIIGARHIISTNYLAESIQKLMDDESIWCVGGKILNEYLNKTGEIISIAMSTAFGMGLGNFRTLNSSGFTDTVTSPMYPYWVFEKIGFFDEDLIRNQDDDFNFRVSKAGGKIFYINEISLKYYVRGSISGLKKQFFQYGYWKVFVNKKHKAITTMRQLVPPLFVLYLCLLPFCLFNFTIFLIGSVPAVFYLFLAFYVSFKNGKGKDVFSILKVFPILHISYGLGYLLGILNFSILNKRPSDKQKSLSR
jgi:GT2 family glycosyltransferase